MSKDLLKKNQQLNNQISVLASSIVNENILEDSNILLECERVYFNNPLIKATIDLLISPLVKSTYTIVIRNNRSEIQQKAKRLVEYTLNNLIDSFMTVKQHALLSIVTGCQLFEIVFNVERFEDILYNRIIRLVPIKNENVIEYNYDNYNNLKYIIVRSYRDKQIVDTRIDSEYLFYVVHNMLYGDIRGVSEILPILNHVKLKDSVLKSLEKTIKRGVGIPIAYAEDTFNIKRLEEYKHILKNLANSENMYALISKSDINKIEFLTVNTNDCVPLLEYINRDIFFNTLTQFLTSGIGQNGSRASTKELRSPYMTKLLQITSEIESYFQWLTNIIIDNSSLKLALKKEDYPIFRFDGVVDTDVVEYMNIVKSLPELGVKLTEEDITHIRSLLGLPIKDENVEVSSLSLVDNNLALKPKIVDFENDKYIDNYYDSLDTEFDMMYNNLAVEIATNIVINKMLNKLIDINELRDIVLKYVKEFANKMQKENSKLIRSLAKQLSLFDNKLNNKLRYLSYSKELSTFNVDEFIYKVIELVPQDSTVSDVVKILIDNKQLLSDVKSTVISDNNKVRLEMFKDKNVKQYKYVAVGDKSTCANCRSHNGNIYNEDEVNTLFTVDSNRGINPDCLCNLSQHGSCRCMLIPIL